MTIARRLGLLLGLALALVALGRTLAAHRQVASPDVELVAPLAEWMLTNFGARDVDEDRTLLLTSLPAKYKVSFTLDGKPYQVWVTGDMTQLRDAVEQVVARHRHR